MRAQDYRPIILKTLRDSAKKSYKTVDEIVDRIIERMEDWEDMVGAAGGNLVVSDGNVGIIGVTQTTSSIILAAPKQEDISERIRPAQSEGIKEYYSKDELFDYYTKQLPMVIEVQPAGFNEPIKLSRFIKKAPGNLGFVKIGYAPPGSDTDTQSASTQATTSDEQLDAKKVMSDIIAQANLIYRAQKTRIEPVAPPAMQSLESGMRGAPSAETDKNLSQEDISSWGQPVANKAADDFMARRGLK